MAAIIAKGATSGWWRTLPFIAGLVIGDLILFALAVAGLAALAAALGPLFALIKWLGVAYLLYLAYRMWTAEPMAPSRTAPDGEGMRLLGLGTLLPLGNPKAIGFYVAILPTVMDVAALSAPAVLTVAAIITVVWTRRARRLCGSGGPGEQNGFHTSGAKMAEPGFGRRHGRSSRYNRDTVTMLLVRRENVSSAFPMRNGPRLADTLPC